MNNILFAEKLQKIANTKTIYVMGCYGSPMTSKNKQRYTTNHPFNEKPSRTKAISSCSKDTFGFDCSGLIKGVLWDWCADKHKTYGGATYQSNGVPDINADGLIKKCVDVSTNFQDIQVGELLWNTGHVGVYIGDGLAVECTYRWKDGVQITAVRNIGSKTGYDGRYWTKRGKLPYIDYSLSKAVKQGDIVYFTGDKHYISSNSKIGFTCKQGLARVTKISPKSKHPYHLVRTDGSSSTVYGWVDDII